MTASIVERIKWIQYISAPGRMSGPDASSLLAVIIMAVSGDPWEIEGVPFYCIHLAAVTPSGPSHPLATDPEQHPCVGRVQV